MVNRPENILLGAAADAVAVRDYLTTLPTDSTPIDITLLVTDECAGDHGSSSNSKRTQLPTNENVTAVLERVIELGGSGDFVYIHFSGHGARTPLERLPPGMGTSPLALALYDGLMEGHLLRNLLVRMENNDMRVTLVLDCCFSGSVLRNPENEARHALVRFVEFDPNIDRIFSREDEAMLPSTHHQLRGASLQDDPLALLKPEKYTILAACGPHEEAREIEMAGGKRRGALSYFLIDTLQTLRRRGSRITHQTLHQHLSTRFHAAYPAQTPMRYGKSSFSFFQDVDNKQPESHFISVYRDRKNGQIILCAGEAHGVNVGDEYAAYQYHDSDSNGILGGSVGAGSIKLLVKEVASLVSELALVNTPDGVRIKKGSIWKARRLSSCSRRKIHIRLAQSVPPADREQLTQAAQGHPYLLFSADEPNSKSCVFQVAKNTDLAYEIQDEASRPIPRLPALTLDTDDTRKALVDILGHLATFKYFERILNEDPGSTIRAFLHARV